MEWSEDKVKEYFRYHKHDIIVSDGRELQGALYRVEGIPQGQLIVFSKILELGTKIKLSTGWWQIINYEGYGLFEDNDLKTYRIYLMLPLPTFQVNDRIKIKYDTHKGIVQEVNIEENYYLVKVRGINEKWDMSFQDKYMLLSREEVKEKIKS